MQSWSIEVPLLLLVTDGDHTGREYGEVQLVAARGPADIAVDDESEGPLFPRAERLRSSCQSSSR